jgi:hypothetical protein
LDQAPALTHEGWYEDSDEQCDERNQDSRAHQYCGPMRPMVFGCPMQQRVEGNRDKQGEQQEF